MNTIITIGRQYGSGGKEIGREAQDMDSQPCHYSEVRGTQ